MDGATRRSQEDKENTTPLPMAILNYKAHDILAEQVGKEITCICKFMYCTSAIRYGVVRCSYKYCHLIRGCLHAIFLFS